MAQEQSRLQKLGRQAMPGWLALKVPPKLPKLAECNAPVGAVRSLVQCHIVDNSIEVDAAQKAMQEYKQAEEKRQAKMLKLLGSRDALRHRIHNHLQQQAAAFQETDSKQKQQLAKRERLQRFNQHVEELKVSLRQENAKKQALKQAEDRQKALLDKAGCTSGAFPEASSSRPPLVTRHVPNHQLPAQPSLDQQQPELHHQGSQVWGVTSCDYLDGLSSQAASATPQVVKARVLDAKQTALEKKVKEKHITLPPLCSCPHELSPLNPQYVYACALNCPLYQNYALYNKLLQSLLYNYDL
ncbi:TPA: Coiled-coil domain containing 15 [Trebouxia sp. C0006]